MASSKATGRSSLEGYNVCQMIDYHKDEFVDEARPKRTEHLGLPVVLAHQRCE
jgi:hypothetical protein